MSKNITLTQLSYIIAVSRYQNFALAARKCFVSQPTLSVQIQKVEDELGVILFDRKRQPIVPTEIGKAVIEQAKLVTRDMDHLGEIVMNKKGLVEGKFRLGIIPTVAGCLIPLFLKSFSDKYPNVELIVSELQTDALVKDLVNDRIDAGIAATPIGNSEILEQRLYLEPFMLYASPKHPLSRFKNVSQADLKNHDVWLMSEGHCFRNQVTQLCLIKEEKKQRRRVDFESGNFQTLIRLVDQNYGVTLLPSLFTQCLNKKTQDTMVKRFSPPEPVREISFLSRRLIVKKAIADALISEILGSLPKEFKTKRRSARPLDPLKSF